VTTPVSPAVVAFTRHAERRALERHLDLQDLGELLLSHHVQRRRNRGQADWLVRTRGIAIAYNWPTATTRPLPSSSAHGASSLRSQDRVREHYTVEGDIVYIRVRSPHGSVRSEEHEWGLRDYDEDTGELVGLEVWSASKVLPQELVEALPRLDGRGTTIERQPA